jgi:hypothetical protein
MEGAGMEQRVSLITLGWMRVGGPPGLVAFDLIAQTLGLYPNASLAKDLGILSGDIGGFSGVTLDYNVWDASKVAPLLSQAIAAGGRIVKPAQDVFWGGHHRHFVDFEGHL